MYAFRHRFFFYLFVVEDFVVQRSEPKDKHVCKAPLAMYGVSHLRANICERQHILNKS